MHSSILPPGETVIVLAPREFEKDKPCTVEGCDRPRRSRGLCGTHYVRAHRALKRRQREASGSPS
jgi:hypothetical protein